MASLNGRKDDAIARLKSQIQFSATLDFYCTVRLEVELLRLTYDDNPSEVLGPATALRGRLAEARAVPLVERIDGVITRCRAALGEDGAAIG